jgi:hypothetical protein
MEPTCNNTHLSKSEKIRLEFRNGATILQSMCFAFGFLKVLVVHPIRIGIKKAFWILTFKWLDEDEYNTISAGIVRKVCKRMGLDYYPVLLRRAEPCATCGKVLRMLVQPESECYGCWRVRIQDTHRLILRAPGEPPLVRSLTEQPRLLKIGLD